MLCMLVRNSMRRNRLAFRVVGASLLLSVLLLASSMLVLPHAAVAAPLAEGDIVAAGPLVCQGNGLARAHISGSLVINSTGGTIRIYDADDIQTTGSGNRFDYGDWTQFLGWIGQITATDTNFNARILSSNISYTATGQGMTWVRGDGTCTSSTGQVIPWGFHLQAIVIQ